MNPLKDDAKHVIDEAVRRLSSHHPDLQDSEVYLGNFPTGVISATNYKTERRVKPALDIGGRPIPPINKLSAVFVDRGEYLRRVRKAILEIYGADLKNYVSEKDQSLITD